MKRIVFSVVLLCASVILSMTANAQTSNLRRPISPSQPMWLIHIDTWNTPDPERIIEMVPEDIRPFVCFNLSLSATDAVCCNGPDVCDSWMRACAAKRVWAMIQPASGSHSRFSDTEFSEYERYFRQFPNFLGWNFAEQFWGFGDTGQPTFEQRLNTFAHILDYCQQYGGYLVVSFTQAYFSSHMMPIAYMRNAALRKRLTAHPENFICCEKYTMANCFFDIESNCLGAYVGGYAGQLGIRFDACGWSASDGKKDPFVKAAGAIPIMEHVLLDGETVIDGPETIPVECSHEVSTTTTKDGYTRRNWDWFPHFVNINIDEFRKILDGTVRIMTREEIIDRSKICIINNGATAYTTPDDLYDGLYRRECDNWGRGDRPHKRPLEQRWWLKSTGRYACPPQCYALLDDVAKKIKVKVNYANYASRWKTVASKVAEFNRYFPEEYTGDIYAAHHENTWMTYNPYQYDDTLDTSTNLRDVRTATTCASGRIPFLYNTCESVSLCYAPYSMGVMKEFTDSISFYLTNYRNATSGNTFTEAANAIDTIRIYGVATEPVVTWKDRARHRRSTVKTSYADGVLTITVAHNGPLDVAVRCAGIATERLTEYTPSTIVTPDLPPVYTDTLQYEAECFDYKNIAGCRNNGYYHGHVRYQGQGFLELGTNTKASIRDTISVPQACTAKLALRYQAPADLRLSVRINNKTQAVSLTRGDDWTLITFEAELKEGTNVVTINGIQGKNVFLDCLRIYDYAVSDGIEEVRGERIEARDYIFDPNGRKMSKGRLSRGIYINGNRKIFIR
ncbi:MAG: glycosyl hydrolase family 98 [Bacteroidaceae bacterium]|nr:glycosyl hydrolase family 98 [Bacteroidaceae bacterium]